MSALQYWIWLSTRPHLTTACKCALLARFGSAEEVYYADPQALSSVEPLGKEQLDSLSDKSLDKALAILDRCARKDVFVLTLHDALYPQRLRNIFDPPLLLYGKGAMPSFDDEAAIAVVGTRSCSPYGLRSAEHFGYSLAREGALVVSGLARGIDASAHEGALRAGGITAAVLGCGPDIAYPAENARLYADILSSGVVLSEYPPGTEARSWHFPVRNRIISGLSVATLVVEAPEKSGALITAATALDQGREVFAVPGPIDARTSLGCNALLRDGAGLAAQSSDILGGYYSRFPHKLHPRGDRPPLAEPPAGSEDNARREKPMQDKPRPPQPAAPALPRRSGRDLSDLERSLLRILDDKIPLLIDEAADRLQLPVAQVLSAVTIMEIDGLIRREGMRKYLRTVEVEETKE